MMGWSPWCYIPSFVEISLLEKTILSGFCHIWVWRTSWSCDQDTVYKISMPLSMEAPYKVSNLSAKRFQRKSLKLRLNFDISMSLGQGQEMTLTLINYIHSLTP